jgi:dipeptidyl aminopeptidase/acylaminoacyl peptidase
MTRSLRPVCALVAVVVGASLPAQPPRPLAIEDYYRVKTVGSPNISRDGKWVAFNVVTRVEENNGTPGEAWVVATDRSSPARRLSDSGANASIAGWLDSRHLRMVSNGMERIVNVAGIDTAGTTLGVAYGATPVANAARGGRGRGGPQALISPNGKFIATVRATPLPPSEKVYESEFVKRHEERFKGIEFDWMEFQRDGQQFPLPNAADPYVNPPEEIFLQPSAGGEERQLTHLGLQPDGANWNRAGTMLVFTADSVYRDERQYGRSDIWTVTTDGVLKKLTSNIDYSYANATFSPDGNWIMAVRSTPTDAVKRKKMDNGGPVDVVLLPATGGKEVNLTETWDYLPSAPFWYPDGKHIYFTGGIGGTTHLFRVAPTGGPVEQVTKGERRLSAIVFDSSMTTMAYLVGTFEAPSEIWSARIDGTDEHQLTHVEDDFTKEVALGKSERLQFTSADGTPIEGWLLYPYGYRPGTTTKYPLIVANHGGPHSADGYGFDFKNQYFAANGYFVLQVNFRSSTGYGEKFLWATWGAWGTKDGQDVMAGVEYVLSKHPIDRTKVAVMGHSYGGFMTNWLITQYPDRFAAAASGAGIANWTSDYANSDIPRTKETEFWGPPSDPKARETMIRQSPITYANRIKTPTLFINGEIDKRVPFSENEQLYVAIKKNGVPAKMIQYAGQPHGIAGSWNNVHRMINERQWFDKYVKGGAVMQTGSRP